MASQNIIYQKEHAYGRAALIIQVSCIFFLNKNRNFIEGTKCVPSFQRFKVNSSRSLWRLKEMDSNKHSVRLNEIAILNLYSS